ncbi:MAG: UDP-N-acetylmuramoyl-L-alanine--D-glutamate ligase [Eubacteriaceae bacterium]|nr:UDP-N-acetylmuramoyl-L-alanine--D-glutamate ligase [Eubacteriaceae bacterium]
MELPKTTIVIGAARSGIAVAKFLSRNNARCFLFDSSPLEKLDNNGALAAQAAELPGVSAFFGRNPTAEEVSQSSLVVLSPSVPPQVPAAQAAREMGIKVVSETEFALGYFYGRISAVTGTNGKTTTTSLLAKILSDAGFDSFPAGNIGDPLANYAGEGSEGQIAALEISSFQLEMAELMKPTSAIITNITPDHLDRHKTMENYIEAKANVFMNMSGDDVLILNYDDPITRSFASKAKCKTLFFSTQTEEGVDAYLSGKEIIIKTENGPKVIANLGEMKIVGAHNAANAAAAALAALHEGAPFDSVAETIKNFNPVEHRIEFVSEVSGVKYYNDSKGTNPDATMVALAAMDRPTVLILGGYDKDSEFDSLFALDYFKSGIVIAIVALGATKEKILDAAKKAGYENIHEADTFEETVHMASNLASEGHNVLLSPACASWGMFENYEQRGMRFKELVMGLH